MYLLSPKCGNNSARVSSRHTCCWIGFFWIQCMNSMFETELFAHTVSVAQGVALCYALKYHKAPDIGTKYVSVLQSKWTKTQLNNTFDTFSPAIRTTSTLTCQPRATSAQSSGSANYFHSDKRRHRKTKGNKNSSGRRLKSRSGDRWSHGALYLIGAGTLNLSAYLITLNSCSSACAI